MSVPAAIVHTFQLTRDDWVRYNTALVADSAELRQDARRQRRRTLLSLFWWGPLLIGGGALLVGRRASTQGMYLEGALGGAAVLVLMLLAMSRLDHYLQPMQKRALRDLQVMDFSEHIGTIRVAVDEWGLEYHATGVQHRIAWRTLSGIEQRAGFVAFHAPSVGFIVPLKELGETAPAYLQRVTDLWRAGCLSGDERVSRYLAERDLPCPKCGYNLRGIPSSRCPECGEALTLDRVYELAAKGKPPE